MPSTTIDLLQGTLDLLIIRTIREEPLHGWGIAQRIHAVSQEKFLLTQGSLYPALYRLEHRGLIESEWGTSENNRRAKFYRLTPAGRRRFGEDKASWKRLADAIALSLTATPQEV